MRILFCLMVTLCSLSLSAQEVTYGKKLEIKVVKDIHIGSYSSGSRTGNIYFDITKGPAEKKCPSWIENFKNPRPCWEVYPEYEQPRMIPADEIYEFNVSLIEKPEYGDYQITFSNRDQKNSVLRYFVVYRVKALTLEALESALANTKGGQVLEVLSLSDADGRKPVVTR